jgi:hypothetical protein
MLFSLFFSYENANTKKGALTMEFPLTLWPEWMLQNLLPPPIYALKSHSYMIYSTMEQVQC